MKRFYVVALVLLACGAGFFGGEVRSALTPKTEPVYAQAGKPTIRIAVFNLEKASRQSKLFNLRKLEWDDAQKQLKEQNDKMQREYDAKVAEIKRANVEDPDDNLLNLRVEAQALEQALKVAKETQQEYLGLLLAQYQKEVLMQVMEQMEAYVNLQKYDIVLQDYEDAASDADFFSGAAYAQSLMSKPVLYVPGIKTNKNPFVTDITQAIIDKLQFINEPPKDPGND